MENVEPLFRALMLSEDKIYPEMEVFTRIITLQSRTHRHHEFLCGLCPRWKLNVPHVRAALLHSKLDVGDVSEESRHVVELRDALFYIRCCRLVAKTIPHLFY
jgi:hypothetical protein